MRLFELFESATPLLVNLVAVTSHLKSAIENRKVRSDWTVDAFLGYLKANDIIIDHSDLLDMIANPPLNNLISNIQGDAIIFKGHEPIDAETEDPDQQKEIVKKMAKNALSK